MSASATSAASARRTTREEWLQAAIQAVRPLFAEHERGLPPVIHVSCGFPSTRALSRSNRVTGECWYGKSSSDGNHHIFISPLLAHDDPVNVLATLIHELVHVAVGHEAGHRGVFKHMALAVGLEGKMTSTQPSEKLRKRLGTIVRQTLKPYPHAALNPQLRPTKKQTTRMLKLICATDGYTVRTTKKWIEQMGVPTCPCGEEFEIDTDVDIDEGEN